MIKYVTFGIAISFISWIVGMICNSMLIQTKYYEKLSNLNFITSKSLNTYIGLNYFKWIVKNTPFRFFNQKIRLQNKKAELTEIRKEMTIAEVSHLIGFIFVTSIALYKGFSDNYLFAILISLVNIPMNLYPALLQQENKRRIDRFRKRIE
ncbi:hypothetical protein GCM10009118_15270 [Wandonia haliotis]|uniref:Glycosyl-4,4'-diaponeurosporenoate acyltransferase n=1 Tax=Wandonia haliotis TaxID=574963 RepID=A0ABP3Y0I8_9FLAO